jgi:cytoskeletal protein CcmA (bactofilin family)
MKTLPKISLIFLVLLITLFAFPGAVLAQAPNNGNDQVVFGGTFTLNSGQTLTGNLVVFGGLATLEKGSVVNGDVALTGGSLNINGEINGSITSVGGSINLSDTAVVDGDINTIGGSLNRSNQAVVKGNISSSGPGAIRLPLNWNLNALRNIPWYDIIHPIGSVLWGIFQSLAVAALALLVVLFMPTPTRRISNAIIAQPVIAGGLGLLTVVVAPALILLLVITILLIPLGLIGMLLLGVAFLFGWIAMGMEAGDRLADLFKVQWAPPVSAGIGTLVLSLFSSIFVLVPCIGWVLPAVIAIVGLGGVFLTRFGTRDGQSTGPVKLAPSTLPQPPVMPAPPAATPFAEVPSASSAPEIPIPPAPPDDYLPPAA